MHLFHFELLVGRGLGFPAFLLVGFSWGQDCTVRCHNYVALSTFFSVVGGPHPWSALAGAQSMNMICFPFGPKFRWRTTEIASTGATRMY
ncbi:hypothetical protein BD779DRAFT_1494203 [Infundibulicybe gibba]|nr:hypothetical protein BD779DRAFT_1494203 [Infundibulicybe gibba]